MSVPTKKRLTEVQILFAGKVWFFRNIPIAKLKPIVGALKEYQERTISWREVAKDRIDEAGGEPAYMLKTARGRAKLTQNELAKILNIPQSNIALIESGKRAIGKKLAKRLAKVFNLDYRVFL